MKRKLLIAIGMLAILTISGCGDDDTVIDPFTVNFNSNEMAISSSQTSVDATLTFSRPATEDGFIEVSIDAGLLTYGENNDFYTSVEPVNNIITLPFTSGDQSVSLSVSKGAANNIEEDRSIAFELTVTEEGLYQTGDEAILRIVFAENFVSPGATLSVNVTKEFTKRAYVDLSKATTQIEDHDNYDLGFYSGSGHYVTLNSSARVMARSVEKTDLNAVTAEDTLGFASQMTIPNYNPASGAIAWVDKHDGDLDSTAFKAISATESENKVFIIRRNGDWKKVRVLQNGDGYILQYADIAATSFNTLNIQKDPTLEEVAVSLDDGIVTATPANDRWDLLYGSYTVIYGSPGSQIPYEFKDYIISNRDDLSVAMVMESEIAYDTFTLSDISGLTFATDISAIGSTWRLGGGPGSDPEVFTDRFYIIVDGEGNTYKLKYTDMYAENQDRGELSFTYDLLNQ